MGEEEEEDCKGTIVRVRCLMGNAFQDYHCSAHSGGSRGEIRPWPLIQFG